VLLLSQWFDPEPTFKGVLFAKELQRLGYEVTVLTGFPNYPGGELYRGYRVRWRQNEVIEGVPVLRVPLYPSHDSSAKRRVANYVSFAMSAAIAVIFIRRPDVAYIYHPPATVGIPALILKWLRGVPFVYDIQDLWPESLSATGMLNNKRALNAVSRLMSQVYRSATRVVVLSAGFRKALIAKGVPGGKIDVIPNWTDENKIDAGPASDQHPVERRTGDSFTVTFAGNIGKGQALETVIEAARILRNDEGLSFLIVGGGIEREHVVRLAEQAGLSNMTFVDRVQSSAIGRYLSAADALLVHLRDEPLFSITIPSKTQAYLFAGRPILMGVRGDAAEMVREANAGLAFEPENAVALAEAIRTMRALPAEERAALGRNGRSYYDDALALQVGCTAFSRILDEASLLRPHSLAVKRVGDVCGAAVGLVAFSVPIAVLALVVRGRIGSPVFFRQDRPGRDGVIFAMRKFRTMTDERDADGTLLPDRVRLTPLGRFLRATSLDELPTLWNVLRGEMSLVGPRPLLTRYTAFFTSEESLRLRLRPGVTGWAQVNGRNLTTWDERLAMDVWYVRNRSLALDLRILGKTALSVFKRSGVVVDPESMMQNLDDDRRAAQEETTP
jgi:Sugar transferases involved in lipopolysaccharide synthesis